MRGIKMTALRARWDLRGKYSVQRVLGKKRTSPARGLG